jgi:hypothetical protein
MSSPATITHRTKLTDIEKQQANRLLAMKAIYEASQGSEGIPVSGPELLEKLGLSDQELGDACTYLKGENLISTTNVAWGHYTPHDIFITHRGIREMEKSLHTPTEATKYFPPAVSVIHIHGNVIGSPIQSGSPGARQEVSVELNLENVRDFLHQLEAATPALNLPVEESRELTAEVTTLKAQIESPRPKKHIIREGLHSVRTILEGAGGNLAAAGLLDALQHIHF